MGHGEAERPAAPERRRHAGAASSSGSRRGHRCARGSSAPSPGTARRSRVSVAASSARRRPLERAHGRSAARAAARRRRRRSSGCRSARRSRSHSPSTHNGWVWFQGGDQIWLTTQGWLLGQLELPRPRSATSGRRADADHLGHGADVRAGAAPRGPAPGARPRSDRAALRLRHRERASGDGCSATGRRCSGSSRRSRSIPLFVDRYQERCVEQFLPQALGLTAMSDFPSMVLVLASARLRRPLARGGRDARCGARRAPRSVPPRP